MTEKALEQKIADCENAIHASYNNFKLKLDNVSEEAMKEAHNQGAKEISDA